MWLVIEYPYASFISVSLTKSETCGWWEDPDLWFRPCPASPLHPARRAPASAGLPLDSVHGRSPPSNAPQRSRRGICERTDEQIKDDIGLDHAKGRSWMRRHGHALMTVVVYPVLQYQRFGAAGRKVDSFAHCSSSQGQRFGKLFLASDRDRCQTVLVADAAAGLPICHVPALRGTEPMWHRSDPHLPELFR